MQFRRPTRRPDSEERILPLINVVFLLLIFFMLAGRLSEAELFDVSPPQSAAAADADAPEEAQAIELLLAADGRLALNGAAIDRGGLEAALAEQGAALRAGRAGKPVTLKADAAADALAVVAVMEILRAAGLHKVQLIAQAAAGGEGRP